MRNLITDYSFEPNTRTITLDKFANLSENNPFSVENIRLIVNETQKVVVCSSMQKDNIIAVEGNTITYTEALAPLAFGDQLTIEVDMGDGFTYVDSGDWVINAKLDALKPIEQQKEWVLDEAKARQLKPIVESSVLSGACASMFEGTKVAKANLSCITKIGNEYAFYRAFRSTLNLDEVDLSGLIDINFTNSLYSMFENSMIRSVRFDNIQTIKGPNSIARTFYNAYQLERLSMPNLYFIESFVVDFIGNCPNLITVEMPNLVGNYFPDIRSCATLTRVDLRSLIVTSTFNNQVFGNCPVLRELHIHALSLWNNSGSSSPIRLATDLTDLYLYGDATNSIYLSWQGSLNFDSIARVLYKLSQNPECGKLVCAFKNINIDDRIGPCDIEYEEGKFVTLEGEDGKGVLQTLYDKVAIKANDDSTANRWNIQNLKINTVE